MTRKPKIKSNKAMVSALAERVQDLQAVNLPADGATLPRQANVEITRAGKVREGRKVQGDSARRLDAFAALKDGMAPGCYDAAKRLERDMHIRFGLHDHGRPEKVDCEPQATDRTDKMVMAGERVDTVMAKLGEREGKILRDLILPQPHHATWRDVVLGHTGEANPHAQCAVVRAACLNLRDAYGRPAQRRAA